MQTGKSTGKSKVTLAQSLLAVVKGMDLHLTDKTLLVNNQPVKTSAIEAGLQAQIEALNAVAAAKTAWMHAVQQQRAQYQTVAKPYMLAVRHYAAAMFGTNSPQYADFGFPSPKTLAKTVVTKVKAVLQNAATRAARHTMGPKQRLEIQGVVTPEAGAQALNISPSTPAPAPNATVATGTQPNGSTTQSH